MGRDLGNAGHVKHIKRELDELAQEKSQEQVPPRAAAVVVGAGLTGLTIAQTLGDATILEQSSHIGGVWRFYANATSRVNSSEPAYRLGASRKNTNHSPTHEILSSVIELVRHCGMTICTHARVATVVSTRSASDAYCYTIQGSRHNADFVTRCDLVVLCTNRRLGLPRELGFTGTREFAGHILRGMHDDVQSVDLHDRSVVILGMGAFAIENMRTTLERHASRVAIVCRRRGTVCPHIIDWINFIRPFGDAFTHDGRGDAIIMDAWTSLYRVSGAATPECWDKGILKPDGHTISVSDMFFVAHYAGRVTTQLGQLQYLTRDCVHLLDGCAIAASMIVACVGFETNAANSSILQKDHMRPSGMVDRNLWLVAEPHLDEAAFRSPFGSSFLSYAQFVGKMIHATRANTNLTDSLMRQDPDCPINTFGTVHLTNGLLNLAGRDTTVAALLRDHLQEVSLRAEQSFPRDLYLEWNRRLWQELHVTLRSTTTLVYPFNDIFSDVMQEASNMHVSNGIGTPCTNVVEILRECLGSCAVEADTSLSRIGIDSILGVEIRTRLESTYDMSLPVTILFDCPTPRAIATFVAPGPDAPGVATFPAHVPSAPTAPYTPTNVPTNVPNAPTNVPTNVPNAPTNSPTSTHLIRLPKSDTANVATKTVFFPNMWGMVGHYTGLTHRLPTENWGIQHPYLKSGSNCTLHPYTVEEQAWEFAAIIRHIGHDVLNLVGASIGATFAFATATCNRALQIRTRAIVLVDPPPPGPLIVGHLSMSHIATELINAARQMAGVGCLIDSPFVDANLTNEFDVAVTASEELARIGQMVDGVESARVVYRRLSMYRHCCSLWERQRNVFQPPDEDTMLTVVPSTGRTNFFSRVQGAFKDDFGEYHGRACILPRVHGEHLDMVQRVCAGGDVGTTQSIQRALLSQSVDAKS